MPCDPPLEVNSLYKEFGDFIAVDNVNFTLKKGEIFGFLGPNGAGKTTTIKMIAGLLKPEKGYVKICGHSLEKEPEWCKQHKGYIPDRPYLYEKLTGYEYLQFVASLYKLPVEKFQKVEKFLSVFDLAEWKHHLIESYSHGMRQKLIISSVFMLQTPLIIVDEPMVGLDPKSARIVKELFRDHAQSGGCVFLSTHSLEVAEELCDRIAIILKGALSAIGSMNELRKEARVEDSGLEDIFLQLTGSPELGAIIEAIRHEKK